MSKVEKAKNRWVPNPILSDKFKEIEPALIVTKLGGRKYLESPQKEFYTPNGIFVDQYPWSPLNPYNAGANQWGRDEYEDMIFAGRDTIRQELEYRASCVFAHLMHRSERNPYSTSNSLTLKGENNLVLDRIVNSPDVALDIKEFLVQEIDVVMGGGDSYYVHEG